MRQVQIPGPGHLDAAWQTVTSHLQATPLVASKLDGGSHLKLEILQPTGSFKVRGALAAVSEAAPGTPLVTASAGNHALGIAYAAHRLGRSAAVVVPGDTSAAKISRLHEWPVELIQVDGGFDDAEDRAQAMARDAYRYISAYNDTDVIAGQSTVGREIEEQVEGPVTVVCGVGGGGLCAGLGAWASGHSSNRVVGVESARSRAVTAAIEARDVVHIDVGATIADGLAGNLEPGCVTPTMLARDVSEIVAVEDDEIRAAMAWLFDHHGLVVEPAGAVGVAAVLSERIEPAGTLVVVLSGRNVSRSLYISALDA